MATAEYPTIGVQKRTESKTTFSIPSGITKRVPCRTSFDTTRPNDKKSTRSSSAPAMSSVSTLGRLLWNRTKDNPKIPPLRNLCALDDTVQLVAGNFSSRSNGVHQQVMRRLSEELGNQIRTETDMKFKREVGQQLDKLLPAVVKSRIRASLGIARTDWIAPLKGKRRRWPRR